MQIKTTMGYHLDTGQNCHHQKNLQTINAWRGCVEKGTLLNWCEYKLIQPQWRAMWRFLKILGLKQLYDTAVLLLGMYSEKTIIQKDTYTPVFIAALFIIARTWRQPRCPSTDKQIKYIYTLEYYSAIKRNE